MKRKPDPTPRQLPSKASRQGLGRGRPTLSYTCAQQLADRRRRGRFHGRLIKFLLIFSTYRAAFVRVRYDRNSVSSYGFVKSAPHPNSRTEYSSFMYDLFTGVVLARPYVGRHKDKPQMLVRNIGRLTDFGRHLVLKVQDGIKLEKKRLFIVDDTTLLRQREARPLSILSLPLYL